MKKTITVAQEIILKTLDTQNTVRYSSPLIVDAMKTITIAFAKWLREQHVMIVQSGRDEHTYCSTFIGGPTYTEEQLWDIFNEGKNCES